MRIGQVAKATGVSVQTVRLYERRGLIAVARRLPSGYRDYPLSAVDDVRAVKQGQRLGFTLTEMKEFVDLQQLPLRSHSALRQFLQDKCTQLDARIEEMIELRNALAQLSPETYDWNIEGDCPITRLLAQIHIRHHSSEGKLP